MPISSAPFINQPTGTLLERRHHPGPLPKPLFFHAQHQLSQTNDMSFRTMDGEERQSLIPRPGSFAATGGGGGSVDHHAQFCELVGVRPLNHPHEESHRAHPQSLYVRAVDRRRGQNLTYMFTATLVNTLLLTQVVLGAALTGLGASNSSRVLITIFGALNTVIAGVVAFLKSRGQPMRARMFRDDLSRVVDEIENSAVMWYGISNGVHGYGAIDTDEQVTVRGEVARLTRLYDKAVKNNTLNDPDMYSANGPGDSFSAGLRKAGGAPAVPGPAMTTAVVPIGFSAGAAPPPAPPADPDASPACEAPDPAKAKSDTNKDKGPNAPEKADSSPATTPAATPAPEGAGPSGDVKPADAPATTPATETTTPPVDDKPASAAAAAASSPPPLKSLPSHVSKDPDESPASSASPPKREASTKRDASTKREASSKREAS
ncbi:hypothetical protein MY3296_005235 [Beauveria thailandica]